MTRRTLLGAIAPAVVLAQEPKRISPHESVSLGLADQKITVVYGRPSLKGRTAYTGDLAPNGEVWRLGADEATKMTLSRPAVLAGKLQVPAGSYSLFAIPGTAEWTVIVNKTANQWGAFKYDQAQDLGRFTVPVKHAALVEEFTIRLDKTGSDSAAMSLAWQDVLVSFPVKLS